jgi:PAS domain S-box-containing protein
MLNGLPDTDDEFGDFEMEHDFQVLGRRTMLVSGRRLPPLDGAPAGTILLSFQDATPTECFDAEETGESLDQFHATLASVSGAIVVSDQEGRVTFMNPLAEKFTGWNKSEALTQHLTDVFQTKSEPSPKTEGPVEKSTKAVEAAGFLDHSILIGRDGSEWPIDSSAAPIVGAGGLTTGTVLVFHDIRDRRTVDRELEFSEVRYRRLFESAHDGILILDAANGKVLDVNPFMGRLLGYPRRHFLGKELWEIGVFKDVESSKVAMKVLQKSGHIRYEDHPLQHSDGRHIPVEFVSNVYREGRRSVIQCNIRDITERKHLAEQLTHAREDAEAASRSKSEFLANMSHEIRTPMSAIVGFADMLLDKTPEECSEIGCVQIIRRNSLHLLELVNDILDLSKVEAGQMEVERIAFDLPALLSEVISLMRPRATEKGLEFGVTFEGPIPMLIQSDAFRLRQILINLLGNALKFTESGQILVRVTEEASGGPNIMLRVAVIDTGIGMTSELVERLFRPFLQGDASITRKFGGTGLGLTISRQLAKLLGGDVTVTSQPGTGSTFTLTIDGGPSAGVERLRDLTEAKPAQKSGSKKEGRNLSARTHSSGRGRSR